MDCIRCVSRSRLRWCFLLCVLSVASASEAATRKHVTMPTAQSVATSPGSGVPVKSGSTLSIPGAAQGEYIPFQPGDRKVPLKVIPTIDYSIPRTINAAKGLLKNNAASIVVGGVIARMVAGLDWVMGDGAVAKQKTTVDGMTATNGSSFEPYSICNYMTASQTIGKSTVIKFNGVTHSVTVVRGPGGVYNEPSGYSVYANCTQSWNGYNHDMGNWPRAFGRIISSSDIKQTVEPLTPQDFELVDAYATAQSSAWLRDLLRESCSGSNAPGRCFDDLKDNVSLSGPSTVTGPTSSTSSTYTKPDGTTGLRTSTTTNNYKVTYGPSHFDFSKTETTIWNEDGQQVGEETVTENDDIEAEEPSEEPKEETSPCSSNCDGPAYVDQYTPTDKTKEQELDSYSARLKTIPIMAAVGGFFSVSVSGAACPVWEYHGELQLYFTSMPINLVFDFHCLPWFVALKPWIQTIMALGCTFIAFRIALL